MNRFLPIVISFAFAGCSTITQGTQGIVFASDLAAVASCQMLGQIQAQSLWGGVSATGVAYNDALTSMKNQASVRGATHILINKSSKTMGGTNIIGNAYRCGYRQKR